MRRCHCRNCRMRRAIADLHQVQAQAEGEMFAAYAPGGQVPPPPYAGRTRGWL